MRSWDDYKVSTELIPVAQTDLGRAAENIRKRNYSVLYERVECSFWIRFSLA